MTLTLDILQAIQAEVARGEKQITQFGTVASMTSDVDALVTFDGSSANIPVKLFANNRIQQGDRIGLMKVGPWWVGIGGFTARFLGANGNQNFQSTGGTTTSGTFGDFPTALSFTFVKKQDLTRVRMYMGTYLYITGAGDAGVVTGLKFSSTVYGDVTLDVAARYINSFYVNVHVDCIGTKYAPGSATWDGTTSLPAGTYTVSAQWARYTGAATLNVGADDRVSIECAEVES